MIDLWGIAIWRWGLFVYEVAGAICAICWWFENRKTIVLKRDKRDWEDDE